MQPVEITRGDSPVVLGVPHSGTFVPDNIWERLNPRGQERADTDWHVDRLYTGLSARRDHGPRKFPSLCH